MKSAKKYKQFKDVLGITHHLPRHLGSKSDPAVNLILQAECNSIQKSWHSIVPATLISSPCTSIMPAFQFNLLAIIQSISNSKQFKTCTASLENGGKEWPSCLSSSYWIYPTPNPQMTYLIDIREHGTLRQIPEEACNLPQKQSLCEQEESSV